MTDKPEYGQKADYYNRQQFDHLDRVQRRMDRGGERQPRPAPDPRPLYGCAAITLAVLLGVAAIILAIRW